MAAGATDPGVPADILGWCRGTGNEQVSLGQHGETIRFVVRRTH